MGEKYIALKIDPVTRIEGHLGLFAKIDTDRRKVVDAYAIGIMFRGFEVILKGRTPDTAIFVTSRSCGVCGGAHANASVLACDMALGVPPTPLGALLRNLAYAMTDYAYDHSVLLCLLEAPDFSEAIVSKLTPSVWEQAKATSSEYAGYHPYKTIGDMMLGWNPIPRPGLTYTLCVYAQRLAKECGSLLYGKFPHPATLVPGGVAFDNKYLEKIFTYYLPRLVLLTLWVKTIVAQWRDMLEFYKQVEVETESGRVNYTDNIGLTYEPAIMLSAGLFEYPFAELYVDDRDYIPYDEFYADFMDKACSKRFHRPGFAIGDKLVETELTEMQRRMIELTTSGYYQHEPQYMSRYTELDPAGKPLADGIAELIPYHEWNKETVPRPGPLPDIPMRWLGEKYSWVGEPRMVYNRRGKALILPFEAGPISKLWVHALYSYDPFRQREFTEYSPVSLPFKLTSGGGRIVMSIPPVSEIIEAARGIVSEAREIIGKIPEVSFVSELPLIGRTLAPDLYDSELVITWENVRSTTLYRLYARAFSLACAILGAWWSLALLLAVLRERKSKWHLKPGRPWKYPSYPPASLGVGWLEAPRGAVRHWIVVRDSRIANYQYHAPSTGNASPRTIVEDLEKLGVSVITPAEEGIRYATSTDYELLRREKLSIIGPWEASSLNCYITEELPPDKWTGLDIVRALRSFDPCMGCAIHAELLKINKILEKRITPVVWTL